MIISDSTGDIWRWLLHGWPMRVILIEGPAGVGRHFNIASYLCSVFSLSTLKNELQNLSSRRSLTLFFNWVFCRKLLFERCFMRSKEFLMVLTNVNWYCRNIGLANRPSRHSEGGFLSAFGNHELSAWRLTCDVELNGRLNKLDEAEGRK